jgi:putative nucleotidyltransferase with HDIG domain
LGHSQRVKKYALLAAGSFSFSSEELQAIEYGALLHDIGKIGIDESILRKPGALTAEESYIIRKHPKKGADILLEFPSLEQARKIILHHHERYDGKGYPEGLRGNDIPIGARLVAVADAFDTMTTDHSYRRMLSVQEAMRELIEGKCTQFCPVATKALIDALLKKRDLPPKVVPPTELKLPAFRRV